MKASDLVKAQELIDEYGKIAQMYADIPYHFILIYPGDRRQGFELTNNDKEIVYSLLRNRLDKIKAKLEALGIEVE